MNNGSVKKIISVVLCAALSALFIVVFHFAAPRIPEVPETSGKVSYTEYYETDDGEITSEEITAEIGKDFTAVRISDISEKNRITKVNYVPDRFVSPNVLDKSFRIVDLSKPFEFAERGSLVFVIMNLDPLSENFKADSEKLEPYKNGDYWYFTLSLPKIFSASNVYCRTSLIAQNGEIENYDFIEYNTTHDKKTEKFSAKTQRTSADLRFYTRRTAMDDMLGAANIITIHYQSAGSAYSGIRDCPLIGSQSAVSGTEERDENLLITLAVISAVVSAVLVVLSVLKKTTGFVAPIVWIFGITLALFSRFFALQAVSSPLLSAAIYPAASFFALGGALLSVGKNFGKLPTKYIFPCLTLLGALLSFISPFVSFGAYNALTTAAYVLKAISVAALAAFTALETAGKPETAENNGTNTVCAALICVCAAATLFLPQSLPQTVFNPLFWLCAVTVAATFISVFILFKETEKSNEYLTSNLHLEVERQVKDIRSVINERDNLLRFVSHDMKKPLLSSASLIDNLLEREKDDEQIKTLNIVKQNTARVIANLSEIGGWAKFNYIAEPSQIADLAPLCEKLFEFHQPDCNANGIVLRNTADKSCRVFVKKQGLENAVSNIILNAVEHANCKTITLSVRREKNKAVIRISDDGKGIDRDSDVFRPYVTENAEHGGVGLFICKNIIESMNGELTYESDENGTTFFIKLLRA